MNLAEIVTFDINNENKFDLWKKMVSRSVTDFHNIPLLKMIIRIQKRIAEMVTGILFLS